MAVIVPQKGPKGDPGEKGDPGSNMEFLQPSPASVWTIIHNLHYRPNVSIQDTAGTVVLGDIVHDSDDQVTVNFSAPFAGRATLT